MRPTREQQAIIDAACQMADESGQTLRRTIKIEAGAGTGKTAMLLMTTRALVERSPHTRILYLAFNKAIQREAKEKFGELADCQTVHGMAHTKLEIRKTKRPLRRLYRQQVQQVIGNHISDGDAETILKTLTNFVQSGDAWPSQTNAPSKTSGGAPISAAQKNWFAEQASQLFCAVAPDQPSDLNLPFDVYLKYWQLVGAPGLRDYDIVLFDEAQDANPVIMAALEMAGNVVYVGDRHQSIYRFTGAVDAMSLSRGKTYPLTNSFRFGPEIARLANVILGRKYHPPENDLRGSTQIITRIEDVNRSRPHARIFRTNLTLIREAMILCDRGTPFALAGDNREFVAILKSVQAVLEEKTWLVHHPLVKRFKSWDGLQAAAHQDDDARDLTQAVRIAEEYGDRLDQVISIIAGEIASNDPLVILTTAHRAKGREFSQVVLMPDFDEIIDRAKSNRARWEDEMNLLYVAATRAIHVLENRSNFVQTEILPRLNP